MRWLPVLGGVLGLCIDTGSAFALVVGPPVVESRTSSGALGVGVCGSPHFARAGSRYLVFACRDPLVPEDTNQRADTYLVDRVVGTIERVSVTGQGEEVPYDSGGGFPSNDGRYVALESFGPLHPDGFISPVLNFTNVFLRDRAAGTTEFISRNVDGNVGAFTVALQDSLPELTEVLLQTRSQLLDPSGNLFLDQINLYIRNWNSTDIELVSRPTGAALANGVSGIARITTTGRYVVFASTATNLPDAPPFGQNLYVRDRAAGTTQRLTRPWHGGEFDPPMAVDIYRPRLTVDGRWLMFASSGTELLPGDPRGLSLQSQVYLLDRDNGSYERISIGSDGQPGNAYSGVVDMSDDGRFLAFFSRASNLPAGGSAIYAIDRLTGAWVNVTQSLGPLVGVSTQPNLEMARDGSAIAFSWRSADAASPYFDRGLIFTVELRGAQAAALPVPALAQWLTALLVLALLWVAARAQPFHSWPADSGDQAP